MWVGLFKNIGGNIPGEKNSVGNFLKGNLAGGP